MSTFLISIYFDEQTNKYISALMDRIASKTSNNAMRDIPPHITVGMIHTADARDASQKLTTVVEQTKTFDIQLTAVGMFGSKVVYIEPVLAKELHELCEIVNRTYADAIHMSSRYKPFAWMPHITIAKHLTKGQQLEVLKVLQDENILRNARVEKLGLATTKPFKDIVTFTLKNTK